jgi:hypothetical protein
MNAPNTYLGGSIAGSEGFVGVNVIRTPDTGYPLMTLMYKLFERDTTVVGDGIDQPGVAAYFLGNFVKFGVAFETCVIEQGLDGMVARFEFPSGPDTWARLRAMYAYVESNPTEFRFRPAQRRDRKYRMLLRTPRNEPRYYQAAAQYLADHNVNMASARAQRDDVAQIKFGLGGRVEALLEAATPDHRQIETDLNALLSGCQARVWSPPPVKGEGHDSPLILTL